MSASRMKLTLFNTPADTRGVPNPRAFSVLPRVVAIYLGTYAPRRTMQQGVGFSNPVPLTVWGDHDHVRIRFSDESTGAKL